ncbi:MAG: intradiol ring-cleavage dioxygenase [Rubrivivax sp.]|nr:intradiol ring-cleavage dioxygenase [Rubrivivax sp.]
MPAPPETRRALLLAALASPALALAQSRRVMQPMTDGPFYPPPRWRALDTDWDADLTQVRRGTQVLQARGEALGLNLLVQDTRGRAIDGCEVEIWQCDAMAAYRHPSVALEPGRHDPGFQGFGAARSGGEGRVAFRTIRPVPYPGRTPHIHVKLRHASFGELTSQLFVAGDAGNARDFLWRQLEEADRSALAMQLQPTQADGLRWAAQHALVVPG